MTSKYQEAIQREGSRGNMCLVLETSGQEAIRLGILFTRVMPEALNVRERKGDQRPDDQSCRTVAAGGSETWGSEEHRE